MLFGTYTPKLASLPTQPPRAHPQPELTGWLVSDSLVSAVSAATVSDCQPADHYGVTMSLSPAAAPPRGPGVWSMPPFIISHPAFKALMTAQVQAFMQAHPVSSALSRAVKWDQLKVRMQDVARHFSSTLHAERTTQLRALKVRASIARAAYLTDPANQQALQQLRDTAATLQQHRQQQAATDALRAGVLLHEYGDQSTYYFHHLHRQRQQAIVISHLQQHQDSPLADLCTEAGRQQASSIISSFFSADSADGMFRQLPTDMSAQQTLLSSLDRLVRLQRRASHSRSCTQLSRPQLVAKSLAQMPCHMSSSPSSGICLAQSCWQSCKTPSRLSMPPACQPL